jgi:integrase/recombinase XerD
MSKNKGTNRRPAIVEEMEAWLKHLGALGRSSKTVATYAVALKNLRTSLIAGRIKQVRQITPAMLIAWQGGLSQGGCAPATVDLFTRAVRLWMAWMADEGRLLLNPAQGLTVPRLPKTLGIVPTVEEMMRLLRSVSGTGKIARRDRALLELAYSTGARLGELTQLDVTSVDLDTRLVRLLGKFGRDRMVPLTTPACRALSAYVKRARPMLLGDRQDSALFISSRVQRRMASSAVAAVIVSRARRAGLELTPHCIRRAFATHLLRGDASPAAIRELLGHQSYRHLAKYLRLQPSGMIRAHRQSRLNQ